MAEDFGGEQYYFRGFMYSLLPPLYFGFSFNPETYSDNYNPNYTHHGSPGSRFKYPVYTGMSERVISFSLKLDESYPAACEEGLAYIKKHVDGGHPESTEVFFGIPNKYRVETAIATLETMKLPASPFFSNTMKSLAGNFVQTLTQTHSSPPMVGLTLSYTKHFFGYVQSVSISPTRFNREMETVAADVDIEYIVAPNLVTTTFEDALRAVKSTANLESIKGLFMK
jgi:hypothetical protein